MLHGVQRCDVRGQGRSYSSALPSRAGGWKTKRMFVWGSCAMRVHIDLLLHVLAPVLYRF
eukprot:5280402-Pyramimonas_sp.AAC.1